MIHKCVRWQFIFMCFYRKHFMIYSTHIIAVQSREIFGWAIKQLYLSDLKMNKKTFFVGEFQRRVK